MSEFLRRLGREIGVEPGNQPTRSDRLRVRDDVEAWKSRYMEEHGHKPKPTEIADAGIQIWRRRGARI